LPVCSQHASEFILFVFSGAGVAPHRWTILHLLPRIKVLVAAPAENKKNMGAAAYFSLHLCFIVTPIGPVRQK